MIKSMGLKIIDIKSEYFNPYNYVQITCIKNSNLKLQLLTKNHLKLLRTILLLPKKTNFGIK